MKKTKATQEKGPHPYDFSLKRDTKDTRNTAKAIRSDLMAAALLRTHGLEKARQMVTPLTVDSFKDNNGVPVAKNESAAYWKSVLLLLKRSSVNATAS